MDQSPYWGHSDASIQWCEKDYHVSPYVAEFWNTLSSLPIALFGLLGWIAAKKHAQAEMRFDLAFFGLFIVGLGSTAFHATMRRYAQSMDELPMMWACTMLLWNAVDFRPPADMKVTKDGPVGLAWTYRLKTKLILAFTLFFSTIIYFYIPGLFLIFFIAYSSTLVSFNVIMVYQLFFGKKAHRKNLHRTTYTSSISGLHSEDVPLDTLNSTASSTNSSSSHHEDDHSHITETTTMTSSSNPRDRPYSPILTKLYWFAFAGYFGGFAFWIYEVTFCSTLPTWIQFHAIWHIMAGLGTFCVIQCQIAWRGEELGGKTSIEPEKGIIGLPVVVIKYDV